MGTSLGTLLGFSIYVLLWMAALENGKKRKIGLTITSFLSLFLTPIIGCIVPLFTKRIDKTQKYPTYKQRLPYENTTAMLIAAILYTLFGLLALFLWIMSEFEKYSFIVNSCILLYGAYTLFNERKELQLAKKELSIGESDDAPQMKAPIISGSNMLNFVFVSNVQQRIVAESNSHEMARSVRRIEVRPDGEDEYWVNITDGENGQAIILQVPMHKDSYSAIDECWALRSNDVSGEYTLNVFYKDGQVYKCIIYRKSKDIYIHYLNE